MAKNRIDGCNMTSDIPVESHPWGVFLPEGAKVVLMGTFPPPESKWSMRFYYPNRANDFWRIMCLLFLGDPLALYDKEQRAFRVEALQRLLIDHHIAIAPTTTKIRRLKGNASDKHLEIVEMIDLPHLLHTLPHCQAIGTTGEKAASVIAQLTDTPLPKIGEPLTLPASYMEEHHLSGITTSDFQIWRLPSTSRAYPLPIAQKAEYYATLFRTCDILP